MTQPAAAPDMSPTSAVLPSALMADIPPAVQTFAEAVGAAPYLPGVLAFVRGIVPAEYRIRIGLECDAETSDEQIILFEVAGGEMAAEEMFRICRRWSAELPEHCPLSHTFFFRFIIA